MTRDGLCCWLPDNINASRTICTPVPVPFASTRLMIFRPVRRCSRHDERRAPGRDGLARSGAGAGGRDRLGAGTGCSGRHWSRGSRDRSRSSRDRSRSSRDRSRGGRDHSRCSRGRKGGRGRVERRCRPHRREGDDGPSRIGGWDVVRSHRGGTYPGGHQGNDPYDQTAKCSCHGASASTVPLYSPDDLGASTRLGIRILHLPS